MAASTFSASPLLPSYCISCTVRFGVIDTLPAHLWPVPRAVYVDLNCDYTRDVVVAALRRRPWVSVSPTLDPAAEQLQFADFENIHWESVLAGKHGAASYLVRKGLSRKAQLAMQVRRHVAKQAQRQGRQQQRQQGGAAGQSGSSNGSSSSSSLGSAVPHTVILETWAAFEEIKMDIGGGRTAAFDVAQSASLLLRTPLRQRLEWALDEAASQVRQPERRDWLWILKPSVTNKGADISLHRNWDTVLDSLEALPDIREWVLQRYIGDLL